MRGSPQKVAAPAVAEPGHNKPSILTPDMLARDFAHLQAALDEVTALAKAVPPVAEDDEDLEILRSFVRRCMTETKRFESTRVDTKEPYLSAERVVDSHFNRLKAEVAKMQAKAEVIAKRLLDKRVAEEKARLAEEARAAAQAAREAAEKARLAEAERIRQEQERLRQEQEQERARQEQEQEQLREDRIAEAFSAPSIVTAAPVVAEVPVSQFEIEHERRVEHIANSEAITLSNAALRAAEAVNVKPADLARTRTGDGISTLATVYEFEIVDHTKIKPEELWEFISAQEVQKAVGRFVALHKDQRPLSGVRIFQDTRVRMT